MPRTRNLKPGFFKNEELAQCSPLARLLFAGLWCWADCNGILEDRPLKLKAEILPFDDCDCNALLGELAEHGLVVRYTLKNKRYLFIPTFRKHQNLHPKETPLHPVPVHGQSTASQLPATDQSVASRGFDPMHPPKNAARPGLPEQAAESRGFASHCTESNDSADSASNNTTNQVCLNNPQNQQSLTESRGLQLTGNLLATDQPGFSFSSFSSLLELPLTREARACADSCKEGKNFDNTPQGLAQLWCFHCKRRKNRASADKPEDMTPFFGELIKLGFTPEQLSAEILRPERDGSEYDWQFKQRLIDQRGSNGKHVPETHSERVRRIGEEMRQKEQQRRQGGTP